MSLKYVLHLSALQRQVLTRIAKGSPRVTAGSAPGHVAS